MKLLLIEDEADLRTTLAQVLREEGYAVDVAEDGQEGGYKAGGGSYDAIVLDLMLPVVDGWAVLRQLRRTQRTPVLVLTARDAAKDRISGLDLGADDYVVKPFDVDELCARLRALIRRSAGHASSELRIGAVTVDLNRKVVCVQDTPVELTAREYALIELLALNPGRVVSRTLLYDHLFAEDDEAFSNLLDVHVCNLRKKLGRDLIQTRRGQGYVLREG